MQKSVLTQNISATACRFVLWLFALKDEQAPKHALGLATPTQWRHAAFCGNGEKRLHLWSNYQEPCGNVFPTLHDNLSFPSALPSFSEHRVSSPDLTRHHSLPLPRFLYAPLHYDVSYHTRTCHANQATLWQIAFSCEERSLWNV